MTDTVHLLLERYGLIAVFVGCIAEGESIAIIAGFFAHQHVFGAWQAFAAIFLGAFLGDAGFFLAGRYFADQAYVRRLRDKPGFARATQLVREHPAPYVILNRYVYGFRTIGGVAAGLSGIPLPTFLMLNAISSLIWATVFGGIGYVFGVGAEQLIGNTLLKHERLLIGLAVGIAAASAAAIAAYWVRRRVVAAG